MVNNSAALIVSLPHRISGIHFERAFVILIEMKKSKIHFKSNYTMTKPIPDVRDVRKYENVSERVCHEECFNLYSCKYIRYAQNTCFIMARIRSIHYNSSWDNTMHQPSPSKKIKKCLFFDAIIKQSDI